MYRIGGVIVSILCDKCKATLQSDKEILERARSGILVTLESIARHVNAVKRAKTYRELSTAVNRAEASFSDAVLRSDIPPYDDEGDFAEFWSDLNGHSEFKG